MHRCSAFPLPRSAFWRAAAGRATRPGPRVSPPPAPPPDPAARAAREPWRGRRHRAFGDALATAHVLRALLGRAAERGVETLEDLVELHDRPRHAKTRNAEVGTRNIGACASAPAIISDSSAFRVPRSDF